MESVLKNQTSNGQLRTQAQSLQSCIRTIPLEALSIGYVPARIESPDDGTQNYLDAAMLTL